MKKKEEKKPVTPPAADHPKKKKSAIPVLLILVAVLSLTAAGGYYYYQRLQPQKAAEKFMSGIQALDFDKMASMLQSQDLSILNNTNIRDEAYEEFFRTESSKLSYEVVKNNFSLTSGTADVTLRVNYVDCTDIYQTAMGDVITGIRSASLKEKKMSAKEITDALSQAILNASKTAADQFVITEVTYPMIRTNEDWKVVTIDDETLKIMSANFTNAEQALYDNIASAGEGKQVEFEQPVGEHEKIDMETANFTLTFTQARVGTDFTGAPCLMIYYDYTNNSDKALSPMTTVQLRATQSGASLQGAIPETKEDTLDHFMSEVAPGQTINVCQPFTLNDKSDVTLYAADASDLDGATSSQIIKIR